MTKRFLVLAACIAVAGCGGDDKQPPPPGSTASSRTFQYGTAVAQPAPAETSNALESALAFQSAPTADNALASTGLMTAADSLLDSHFGGAPTFKAGTARAQKLAQGARRDAFAAALETGSPGFDPTCYTQTPNSVTFRNCTVTESSVEGQVQVTLNGQVTAAPGALQWDLVMSLRFSSIEGSVVADYHDAGNFAVTATTAVAHQGIDFSIVVSAGGRSARLAMEQSADLDVTHAPTCATNIIDGTFEAKRVWTAVPNEFGGAEYYRNGAVKVDWTGCGTATVAYSVTQ